MDGLWISNVNAFCLRSCDVGCRFLCALQETLVSEHAIGSIYPLRCSSEYVHEAHVPYVRQANDDSSKRPYLPISYGKRQHISAMDTYFDKPLV